MRNILFGIGLGFLIYQGTRKGIGLLKPFKFIPVYNTLPDRSNSGKTNINFAKGKSGVYIIRENERIVYIGSSGVDLYKTSIRHFQQWNDGQYRVSYRKYLKSKRYSIRFVFIDPKRMPYLEAALIEKYKPRDNYQSEGFLIENEPEKTEEIYQIFTEAELAEVPF